MAYRLWRQDDNGQRVLMATFADRASAEAQATALEARAHKQLYWVDEVDASKAEIHVALGHLR